jgi:hypothetical protein
MTFSGELQNHQFPIRIVQGPHLRQQIMECLLDDSLDVNGVQDDTESHSFPEWYSFCIFHTSHATQDSH